MDIKSLLTTIEGRIPRSQFWIGAIVITVINIVGAAVGAAVGGGAGAVIQVVFSLAMIWPSICVSAKRFHDRNKSGWWQLIALVPAIGAIWMIVECGCLAGIPGANRFGPDPLGSRLAPSF